MAGFAFIVFVALCNLCMISETMSAPQSFKEAKMPAICDGKNYCHEKSNDYPQELIDKILEEMNYKIKEVVSVNDVEDRYGFDPEDDCDRDTRIDLIYEILDNDGLVRYVIQSSDKFQQRIKTESCRNPGRLTQSKFFEQDQLRVMDLSCTEKRIKYWFKVLSLDGSGFEVVNVKGGLPVCCSCRLNV